MISQKQQLSLQQKLSPQQIMLMRLLQVPAISLEQTIKDEIEKNPLLEEEESNDTQTSIDDSVQTTELNNNEKYDVNDYSDEENIPNYKLASNNYSNTGESKEIAFSGGESFHEYLLKQLELQDLSEKDRLIGIELIGNIDDAGYLERDINAMVNDFLFRHNIDTNSKEIENVLHVIQSFDPSGIAARSLQECLLIQLQRKAQTSTIKNAICIIEEQFESFSKKHYDKITKRLHLSEQELKEALDEIIKLNPKPGNSIFDSEKIGQYIIPDFIVYLNGNDVEFVLNDKYVPNLKVSKYYSNMLQNMGENKSKSDSDKKIITFIKEKMDSAKWFIDAIKQRQDTLNLTMEAIIEYQKDFFINGDVSKLKPMRLKEIADMTKLDISTISRVVNQKYAQTHFGTFLLKDFFSKSYTNDEGEDVATDSIKQILIECINSEDKQNPLTDEELKEVLNQKGFPLARRTVAKYRESLRIPVGRLRKELKDEL